MMKTTFAFLLCLSASSLALLTEASAQSRQVCRNQCGYIETHGPNSGKASQTPAVNACYRACMRRSGAAQANVPQR
jgi:hypothetical protein